MKIFYYLCGEVTYGFLVAFVIYPPGQEIDRWALNAFT